MEIGSVTSMSNISNMQMSMASSTDPKLKSIQDEITDVQQKIQKLSSKEELSVMEKADEKKKLKKEKASLNTELKLHQEELLKSQKRKIKMTELLEDNELTKTGKPESKLQTAASSGNTDGTKANTISSDTDTGLSSKETHTVVSADTSIQQAGHQGTVISQTNDGIVILKEKSDQDEKRDVDTEEKQTTETSSYKAAELNLPTNKIATDEEKEEVIAEKETKTIDDTDTGLSSKEMHAIVSADTSIQQADSQRTVITRLRDGIVILKGEIDQDEKRGVDTEKKRAELEKMEKKEQRATAFQFSVLGEANNRMKSAAKANVSGTENKAQATTNNAFINAFKASQENPASQEKFYVSLGH